MIKGAWGSWQIVGIIDASRPVTGWPNRAAGLQIARSGDDACAIDTGSFWAVQPESGSWSPFDALVPFDALSGIPVLSLLRGVLGAMEAGSEAAATAEYRRRALRQMSISNAIGVVGAAASMVGVGVAIYDLATERRRREHDAQLQIWVQAWQHAFVLEQQRDAERLRQETLELQEYIRVRPFREFGQLGSLRSTIGLKGPREMPTLLIPAPPSDLRGDWDGVRWAVAQELESYADIVKTVVAKDHFDWPDASLLRYELDGLPVLFAELRPLGRTLHARFGGAHLLPNNLFPVLPAASIASLAYDRDRDVDANHEFAARWAAYLMVRAADEYHLMHRVAYDERADRAAARAGLPPRSWSAYGIDLALVRDRAYHLLHVADRQFGWHDRASAEHALRQALDEIIGTSAARAPKLVDQVAKAAGSGRMTAAHKHKLAEVLARLAPDARYAKYLDRAVLSDGAYLGERSRPTSSGPLPAVEAPPI